MDNIMVKVVIKMKPHSAVKVESYKYKKMYTELPIFKSL